MVAQSEPTPTTPGSPPVAAEPDRGETIQYLTRLFTVLSFASIYVLIQAARRKRTTTALASSRLHGEGEAGGRFTPAEIGATVSLAASLAWLLFILLPVFGFGRRIRVGDRIRTRRTGFESGY